MKLSPNDHARSQRLGPSKFSAEGFLGDDTRTVEEIVAQDRQACDALGIEVETIAARLAEAYAKAESAFGDKVAISDQAVAELHEAKGRLPCPFGGHGTFAKGEVTIVERRTRHTYHLTPLSLHLIGEHGFFQGRGSRYRIDPESAARFLCLSPPSP